MKISIALALHNGADHIREQLQSILKGTRLPDEWIVVDDASTDGSAAILGDLFAASSVSGVRLLRNEQNIGATRTFVAAVAETTGDMILFCDQDDIWHPEKISMLADLFIQDPSLLLAYHDGDIIDVNGIPDGRTIWGTRRHAHLALGAQRNLMEVAANPDIKGCTMALNGAFARNLFRVSPLNFTEYWGHDHWSALMAWGSGPVKALPERCIKHRLHRSNTSGAMHFNPLSFSQWSRRMKTMRKQAPDHFVQRYVIAKEMANSLAQFHDNDLAIALSRHLTYAERRMRMQGTNIINRLSAARLLWNDGYYGRYANGAWTLLRDVLT